MSARLPGGDRAAQEVLLVGADHVDADRVFELEHQPGPDRLEMAGVPPSSRWAGS